MLKIAKLNQSLKSKISIPRTASQSSRSKTLKCYPLSCISDSTFDDDLFDDEGERSRFSFSPLGRRDLLRLSDGIFNLFFYLSFLVFSMFSNLSDYTIHLYFHLLSSLPGLFAKSATFSFATTLVSLPVAPFFFFRRM